MQHLPPARKRAYTSMSRIAVVSLVATSLTGALGSPASAAITATSSAPALAAALAGPGTAVTGASFTALPPAGTPHAVADTPLASFPSHGSDYAILSTGDARLADNPNTAGNTGVSLGGGAVRGDTDRDVSVLKIDLSVPASANCLRFDFRFLSEEYPEWVGRAYNDAFIAELDSSTWTTSGSTISAPGNFAFDPSGNPISINAAGVTSMTAANAAGTTYDGATPLLSAAKQVTPGAHSLFLSIFDQGDTIYDSAVFVDGLTVGFVPDPATQCRPGAELKQYQVSLTPITATRSTGTTHVVTATLVDQLAGGAPVAGAPLLFSASGANTASGSSTTDAAGEATFGYLGGTTGTDGISACFDIDGSGTCDAGEPVGSASVDWVNSPPAADAGGPYTTDEGTPVALAGSATDADGDALTYAWSATPGGGVDAGAACAFADATAAATTVTCTDDGTWQLALTASDGTDSDTSFATLSVGNVAPTITSLSVPVSPVPLGTPISASGAFTDPGSNDTHVSTLSWGDGNTSSGTSGSHTYAAPGVYSVCLGVVDDDGGSDSRCATDYVVVYDPDGGFVTGGGHFQSPAGAYTADPAATGRANFGFVSKYKKGASTPTGSTEFQFKAASLNFHSNAQDWLVVSGPRAQYKGTGTVNGSSGYSFLLSAVDGQRSGGGGVDRIRMKIWETASGVIVYDNQSGDADTSPASTAISGGSIVIHS